MKKIFFFVKTSFDEALIWRNKFRNLFRNELTDFHDLIVNGCLSPLMIIFTNFLVMNFIQKFAIPYFTYPNYSQDHYLRFFSFSFSITLTINIPILYFYLEKLFNYHIDFYEKLFDLYSFLVSALILSIAISPVKNLIDVSLLQVIAISIYPANGAIKIRKILKVPFLHKEQKSLLDVSYATAEQMQINSRKKKIELFNKTNKKAKNFSTSYKPHRKYK